MEIKRIEVVYGVKRPLAKFSSENISVTLAADVRVKDDEDLKKEVHSLFLKAREQVETEQWASEQFRN